MKILAIDTSADETSAAVTDGRKILSNVRYSQILAHTQWGGIVPSIAKRAHQERIDFVIQKALKKAGQTIETIDYIAVTYGPGLSVALEVGIAKAKELSKQFNKKIIPVNHLEGHIYSCFVQNSRGNPKRPFQFPYIVLSISGGHTMLAVFDDHLTYKILGETVDDAAGEALDKAAKMLGLGYPGGPIIEKLASLGDRRYHYFPRPMRSSLNLDFSFSGLKTSFLYFIRTLSPVEKQNHMNDLAASYQEAVFDSLLFKLKDAVKKTGIKNLLVCGGVAANSYLRQRVRSLAKEAGGSVLFPSYPMLTGDNAAMIGVVAYYKAKKGAFVEDVLNFEREPRAPLTST